MGYVGQTANIGDLSQWIGRGFHEQKTGFRPNRMLPSLVISQIDKSCRHTKLSEIVLKQYHGIAEHAPRTHHMVARFEQAEAGRGDCRHARCDRNTAFAAFHRRQALLERSNCGIGES